MGFKWFKSFMVAALGLFLVSSAQSVFAQHEEHAAGAATEEKFNPGEAILHHIADAHEWHFFSLKNADGTEFHGTIPLPVILYSPQRGFSTFMSSAFHHGTEAHNGYKLEHGKVVAVDEAGTPDETVKVYDFSMTKNVVQMLIALIVLVWLLTAMAKKYKTGQGVTSAPKGMQNAIEPVITFVRDDVAKPNLGPKYQKFLPYLLTIFFFILINNIFGLLPGAANVTGNIAFTAMLGIISFFVILFNTNGHYWQHIFWFPGVPLPVKLLMMPVELLGVFTKPFALIIRLFANMTAGHIIILSFVSLIFIFTEMSKTAGVLFTPVSIAFAVFIYLIEILVAFIQAYIFTNLTAVFIGGAIGDHHYEEDIVTHH
ncbi:F0F1 ATP synthase subunit A [Niabella pedocola]|uniref:ATP synthase subunit a n=1 Tax=Niabella pedocola TaxID=1752077 RepID=A0ABS8PUH8_9BACT|nr:F0F1 ATP synthase subunit A [Niabella pedocola]MCD2424724.1 F0F1 ATP synthase subunit A [Niabella pedocola]